MISFRRSSSYDMDLEDYFVFCSALLLICNVVHHRCSDLKGLFVCRSEQGGSRGFRDISCSVGAFLQFGESLRRVKISSEVIYPS